MGRHVPQPKKQDPRSPGSDDKIEMQQLRPRGGGLDTTIASLVVGDVGLKFGKYLTWDTADLGVKKCNRFPHRTALLRQQSRAGDPGGGGSGVSGSPGPPKCQKLRGPGAPPKKQKSDMGPQNNEK